MKTVLLPLTARATLPARLLQAAASAMAPATADATATATTPGIAFRIARARDATVAEQLVVSRLRQTHAHLFADDSDFVVDFGSRDDLHEALDGCDGLVVATAADPVDSVETTLVEAARAVGGVKDVLKVSCPQGFLGEKSAVALGAHHWHVEQRIRQLQFEGNVRFVRPATLMDTLLQGKRYEMICGRSLSVSVKRGRVAFVHPADVAEVMHALLVNKGSNTTGGASEPEQYAVTGPEALTFQEVADQLSAGIGQRVTYSYLPLWAVQPSMWIRGERPEAIASEIQTARATEEGAEADVVSTVEDVLGKKPRTLRQFIKEHEDAWPLRAYK